jgi:DNA-binding NtrC family response regulator
LKRAIDYARAVAPSAVPILITGEPGTGKEVMARMVHDASGRVGRFLVAECAGAGPDIVESELFGHEAGAFPEAIAPRAGRLEEAALGTIFLREIGALTPLTQARLATVLQSGIIRTASDGTKVPLRARLIASSSRDLAVLASSGAFRADLLAHLRLVRVDMPSLRARAEDIELLSAHFVEELAVANGLPIRSFSVDALRHLSGHDWPGNVRELEDVVHRAILLARGPVIEADALVLSDGSRIAPAPPAPPPVDADLKIDSLVGRSVADVERELILQTLKSCGGNRTTASTILGISVRTMRNKLKSFVEAGIAVSPAF